MYFNIHLLIALCFVITQNLIEDLEMDATKMTFESDYFDVITDKGTLDALIVIIFLYLLPLIICIIYNNLIIFLIIYILKFLFFIFFLNFIII